MQSVNQKIPCVLMRSGTSRGPFFLKEWLPADPKLRDLALIGAIGASDPLQLDGLGGNSTLNSKVAIVSRSSLPDCDLDYLFAQVGVGQATVDVRPNCGNMLSGVAPFAIEQGLIEAQQGTTTVRIHNVNTGSKIEATVQTPNGKVTYEGSARIDGVVGTAAPVLLTCAPRDAVTAHAPRDSPPAALRCRPRQKWPRHYPPHLPGHVCVTGTDHIEHLPFPAFRGQFEDDFETAARDLNRFGVLWPLLFKR